MVGKHEIRQIFFLVAIMLIACSAAFADENKDSLNIVPDQIQIGTFYHGAEVQVSANVAACDGAVIVLEGGDEKVGLNRKGRVAFIWMNVAQITISGLPRVYIMAASDKMDDICSKETQEKLRLGTEYLRPQMEVHSDQPLTGKEFDQFLKLKTHIGTYDTNNQIDLKQVQPGRQEISSILPIPSQMPPGIYDVHLYCFRRGNLAEEEMGSLKIERVGLPDLMINLANKHAAVYGLVAIVIAMAVGIIMGFIFSSLPGREH
jgi:uncharacterized protein (TIGR02186 family)